jgi:putative tryptophan/tyrosine transport system substrate-binding protein
LRRIGLVVVLAISLTLTPFVGKAQQAAPIPRIGFLSASFPSDARMLRFLAAFRQGLHELGYVEGQNIAIESRWAEGQYNRLPGLATELVRLKVNAIVTYGAATQAAQQATGTIPIVMGVVVDPVTPGFAATLARPGGNVTGLSSMAPELVGKQLEILKEILPKVTRVALLGNPVNSGNTPQLRQAQNAARALGLRLQSLESRNPNEIDSAFVAMTKEQAGAVVVLVDSMLIDQRTRIANLAARYHLPTVAWPVDHAEAGALVAYGPNVADMFRRAATYVDKIMKGAKPADLPIEQPTKFELVVNLKTAKALGLTIPHSLLLRADQVIQ